MTDDETDKHEFSEVCVASIMSRQYEVVALKYKQAIEDATTLPSERKGMTRDWADNLAKAQYWAKQRDQACDVYIAGLSRGGETENDTAPNDAT